MLLKEFSMSMNPIRKTWAAISMVSDSLVCVVSKSVSMCTSYVGRLLLTISDVLLVQVTKQCLPPREQNLPQVELSDPRDHVRILPFL